MHDDSYWEEYESGPFCQHWSDLGECDMLCKCGHECRRHDSWDDNKCGVEDCKCDEFKDPQENEQ